MRGRSPTAVFDLGTLLPEVAAIKGVGSFSLMVVPGPGSSIAGLNPSTWTYEARPASGGYLKGIEPLTDAAWEDDFTLIDLPALRSVAGTQRGNLDDDLFRIIHGFDMLLVMSGSTPSANFRKD